MRVRRRRLAPAAREPEPLRLHGDAARRDRARHSAAARRRGRRVQGPMRLGAAPLLAVAYVGGAMSMWGTLADTAWHRTNARDSFWSPPHLFMYSGGLIVWAAVIFALVLATRGQLADVGGPVWRVGRLRLPFGFALGAFGVLIVVSAAPFDIWYHAVFGKDVLIWSPPHTMGHIGGMVAAAGLVFAAAAQCERGVFRRRWLWTLAVLLPAVHFIH